MINYIKFDAANNCIVVGLSDGTVATYTPAQEAQYIADTGRTSADFVALAASAYPGTPIETVRVAANLAIDKQAGDTRRKYITGTTGQDATYLQKAANAAAYKAAGYPSALIADYPMVRAEGRAIYGATPSAAQYQAAADYILATETAFVQKGADIEEARRAGKIAVEAALTVAAVRSAQDAALAALVAL